MMKGNEHNKLMKGALLLTLAGFISKLLSAGYRIPLQNLTGDLGFYVYQQVYPFLAIAMILALYGFPSAISKMTVDMKTQGRGLSLRNFYIPVFLLLFFMSGSVFLFLVFNAEEIAVWAGDPNLKQTYQLAAFIFLVIPFPVLMRGVFQGMQQMQPTAYSQIGEQLTRVILIIAAAVWFYLWQENIYAIGRAAVVASVTGALIGVIILLVYFIRYKPVEKQHFTIPWHYYVKSLFILGIAAALNHMVLVIIQFADTLTLIPSLQEYGLTKDEAMKTKGVFDRGQPLIQLGTVLGSSFALALMPVISDEKLKQNAQTLHGSIRSAMLISFYLAVGAAVGLITIFPETNRLLFQNDDGTGTLRILAIAVFLSSIGITAASILQGLGYMKRTAGFIAAAFFLKWIGNQTLVPLLGIDGSALATVLSLAVFAGLMLIGLKRKLPGLHLNKHVNWAALLTATTGMVLFLLGMDYLIGPIASRFGLLLYVMFISIVGAMIYLALLLRLKAFTDRQLSMLPFARVWIRIHKERDR
ncbi:polysaccharide biosynthesis protein [Lentibacillus sp. CBA3610]|uniref:putative polysaccharide biosynthesis protein n=1 Tax=Lentibacillus sp. CBA3610 TaxID=2518176 RepID=UPI001595ABFB|nr:polysaccharide biosynthesis protein [Lentibacillus sp. CBA3610]QKY70898.1 polysaccharide biosynthesis protein [Lentibacillus sp. CBA3610]